MKKRLLPICLFLAFAVRNSVGQNGSPLVRLQVSKPSTCNKGKGMLIEKAFVKSGSTASVDIVIYLQRYDGVWTKRYYTRNGSGEILVNLSDCEFTGNYYAFGCFSAQGIETMPRLHEVKENHLRQGRVPKFQVTQFEAEKSCKNGGFIFLKGFVFTPNGEHVQATLFLEKKDGTWRKKHYDITGSCSVELDVFDCDLTGNFKTQVALLD
jgi:hypothetical protein